MAEVDEWGSSYGTTFRLRRNRIDNTMEKSIQQIYCDESGARYHQLDVYCDKTDKLEGFGIS